MPNFTHTLSLSIGGDTPTWEGEATVSYRVTFGRPAQTSGPPENCYEADPDEIDDIVVTHIDDTPISNREVDKFDAESIAFHIECNDYLLDQLLEAAHDKAY